MRRTIRLVSRFLRRLVGRLLIFIGVLYLVFFALGVSGLGGLYLGRGEDLTDHISRPGIAGPFITGAIALIAGLMFLEGKKSTLLFLRPFNSMANERAIAAFTKRLGGRFSVVALDDGSIPAPTTSAWQVLVALLVLLPAALLLFVVAAVVMLSTGQDSGFSQLWSVLALSGAFALLNTARRAMFPKSNKLRVETANELENAVRRLGTMSSWGLRMLIPRTLIVQTTDAMWQQAVSRFGEIADVAVLDLSRRSKSIEWELSFLRANKSGSAMLISCDVDIETPEHDDTFGPIERYKTGKVRDTAFERRLRLRLDDLLHVSRGSVTSTQLNQG
jgi:hypothetical protein